MADAPSTPKDVLNVIKEKEIRFVDFRFTDPRGKEQHISFATGVVDEDILTNGTHIDGSSIAGWRSIEESDMLIKPDIPTAIMDPFTAQPTLNITCNVFEPLEHEQSIPYDRDPRRVAIHAEDFIKDSGIADVAYFGPEPEFFVFDDVRFSAKPDTVGFHIEALDLAASSDKEFEVGNLGHRPRSQGGYFPVPPVDHSQDLRSEMVASMEEMGLIVEKHHHEVGASQHELGIKYSTLTRSADAVQIYKYVVQNVAHSFGKSATFMPKPLFGENGNGMHVHQSLWKDGKPLFAGDLYADLSQTCLHYIGGILKHAQALNAFANPTTNSYKRLVPGYEAPVYIAYCERNRSAAVRIPLVNHANARRIETRFPDPLANPYLLFSALLMAGIDGVINKIEPGKPATKDLYHLEPGELADLPVVCASLAESLEALKNDNEFLLRGDVFSQDQIDGYVELKQEEIERVKLVPHPVEYELYYSA